MFSEWEFLGEGTYNTAYVNRSKTEVLKLQKDKVALDTPERSVRLWNEINPHLHPPAKIYEYKGRLGWVCPFVKGRQATDSEMSHALIDIFNSSGRIVADATAPKNFITTPTGQVICVDIGMALQLEKKEIVFYSDKKSRRKSVTSLDAWGELVDNIQPFFKDYEAIMPQTVFTIKALLFIKNNRPDIHQVDFLKKDLALTKNLAHAYDIQHAAGFMVMFPKVINTIKQLEEKNQLTEIKESHEILSNKQAITLGHIKESCKVELLRYIQSRGSLNTSQVFSPSLITYLFRNKKLTVMKVRAAQYLIKSIEESNSIEELRQTLRDTANKPQMKKSLFVSGLIRSIGLCHQIIETSVKLKPELSNENSFNLH